MASKYDDIKTAAELIKDIQMHGFSTKIEDTCRIQDILGRSSIDELVALANDIGRNNEYGEPDPNGSYSSNRKGTQGTFYSVIFSVWNWEDATRFWNTYTNPDKKMQEEKLAREVSEHQATRKALEDAIKEKDDARKDIDEAHADIAELTAKNVTLTENNKRMEYEIMALKAKLYDLLTMDAQKV